MGPPAEAPVASAIADSRPTSSGTNSRPGLVQDWPVPSVSEPVYPVAMAAVRENAAPGSTTDGLTEPSSPENANGKFDAANTATGPTGRSIRRRSGTTP